MNYIFTSFIKPLCYCCLLALLVSSCTSTSPGSRATQEKQKRAAATQEAEKRKTQERAHREQNASALASINNRIQAYQHKSLKWQEGQTKLDPNQMAAEKISQANACQIQLSDLLNGYLNLQQRLREGRSSNEGPEAEALIRLNQQDMVFLESPCTDLLEEITSAELPIAPVEIPPPPTTQESPEIKQAFDHADYTQVINLYNRQAQEQEQLPPGSQTTLLYAQALIKNYQEDMARGVLQNLLEQTQFETNQSSAYVEILRLLADLDFASGSYEKARQDYEQLVRIAVQANSRDEWASVQLTSLQPEGMGFEEAREYSQLLKNYLTYMPKRDGYTVSGMAESFLLNYPASRLVPNVNQIHRLNQQQAENWLNRGMSAGQDQGQQNGQSDIPVTGWSGSSTAEQAKQLNSMLQGKYDQGTALLAEKNYDGAIALFKDLLGTSYQDQAQSRTEEAARLAAEEARKEAAELYVRASNATSSESKKKLLNSSRELLQGILTKYPQAGLADKVQRNLQSIDQELRTMSGAQ